MKELRGFDRVDFSCRVELVHQGTCRQGCLENISMNGALLHLEEEADIPAGRICLVRLQPGKEQSLPPLQLWAEAVHGSSTLFGVKFVGYDAETEISLLQLMQRLRAQAKTARDSLERIRQYLAQYQESP